MPKKISSIPVNRLPAGTREGIIIGRMSLNGQPEMEETGQSHRDNGHLFIIQEAGTTHLEIDFREAQLTAPSLIYIHPDQVHRLMGFDQATLCSWIITGENIRPEYLTLLEGMMPALPLTLSADMLSLLSETASLCIAISEREQEPLFDLILKESCNTLTALAIAQYAAKPKTAGRSLRGERITQAFKAALEQDFTRIKSPAAYANALNLSLPYLNERVKAVTGQPVSYHIQARVVLEAKRLLYYSDQSVKEIAASMGYDDFGYFVRLFRKAAGMTPEAFRRKNRD